MSIYIYLYIYIYIYIHTFSSARGYDPELSRAHDGAPLQAGGAPVQIELLASTHRAAQIADMPKTLQFASIRSSGDHLEPTFDRPTHAYP